MDNLPEVIMFDIFSRFPVKSLLRLKSVCKSWRSHISNSYFEKLHMVRTLTNPDNHSFIAHDYYYSEHRLFIINKNFLDIANDFKLPSKLNKRSDDGLKIFGSCNGLLCLGYKRDNLGLLRRLYLWNPATKQLKDISNYPLLINKFNYHYHDVSFGFGFDLASNDYKVVRIVTNTLSFVSRAQVYSRNKNKNKNMHIWKDAWKEIKVELKFRVHHEYPYNYLCPAIVKGSPYWIIKQNPVDQQFAMVSFNMQSEKFSTISLPDCMCHELPSKLNIFEFKESVAIAARPLVQGMYIHIWTLDDDSCWLKKLTITTRKITSISGCLETGEFVGKKNELVLYDYVNQVVKPTPLFMMRPRIYKYSESLVNLN